MGILLMQCLIRNLFPQNDVQLMNEGDKVGASEAALLNMLNISPFTYGLVVQQVYDQGTVFSPKVLDITDEDLLKTFQQVRIITIYFPFCDLFSLPRYRFCLPSQLVKKIRSAPILTHS